MNQAQQIIIYRWIILFSSLSLILLLIKNFNDSSDSTFSKNSSLELINYINRKNDSIIKIKNLEISLLKLENKVSEYKVIKIQKQIDSLDNLLQLNRKKLEDKKKEIVKFTDVETENYWKDEIK